jgi:chromosome segregation ATPase
MSNASQVAASIRTALDQADRCAAAESSDNYDFLEAQVDTLDEEARQAVKSQLDIASLLPKLKEQKPLGPAELKTLELLIVGDAEYFLKYEADLDRWRNEANQLIGEIKNLQSSPLDVDALMHLRALCQELRRVLPNIVYYLDQKERTVKFQEATKGPIDAEGYRVLAEMVIGIISSDKI